jgi:starch synthase
MESLQNRKSLNELINSDSRLTSVRTLDLEESRDVVLGLEKFISLKRAIKESDATEGDIDTFVDTVHKALVEFKVRRLPVKVFEQSCSSAAARKATSRLYTRLHRELCQIEESERRERHASALSVLENLGVGEVVFVSPEAQHARAGGLAQYISGLTTSLAKSGVSVTVITPMYELAQGNKHTSAENFIKNGFVLNGKREFPTKIGDISVDIGPTLESGTQNIVRSARAVSLEVYQINSGLYRLIFLRNAEIFTKLYGETDDAESLISAVTMSRGAIETMRSEEFGINPDIVVSNDWVTALIPPYLGALPEYENDPILSRVKTIHMIHNCGEGYQGKFFANKFGEDLWPLLGLADEHFFGLADPSNRDFLNLTAAALFHVKDAIVAVSRPYAVQLLSAEGGAGLQHLFQEKQHKLYGISNGLSTFDVQNYYWRYAEGLMNREIPSDVIFNESLFLRNLPVYKAEAKRKVQEENGLEITTDSTLISFVGRLTEQKGIGLLSGTVGRSKTTVLETLLEGDEKIQILITGPLSPGEEMGVGFAAHIRKLMAKFPGRIQATFDFVTHERALEFTLASDLMLMPSRYEPGGITQLEALAAGTPLVARNVGGIAATLVDNDSDVTLGNSFLFESFTTDALLEKMYEGIQFIRSKRLQRPLLKRMLKTANDWSERVPMYVTLFQHIGGVLKESNGINYLAKRKRDVEMLRPSLARSSAFTGKRTQRYQINSGK